VGNPEAAKRSRTPSLPVSFCLIGTDSLALGRNLWSSRKEEDGGLLHEEKCRGKKAGKRPSDFENPRGQWESAFICTRGGFRWGGSVFVGGYVGAHMKT